MATNEVEAIINKLMLHSRTITAKTNESIDFIGSSKRQKGMSLIPLRKSLLFIQIENLKIHFKHLHQNIEKQNYNFDLQI